MTTLVTGATGHLGANLVRALLSRGERVRALVRPDGDRRGVEGLDVELAVGDLTDQGSLERATQGCERVYHTAALISIRSGDRAQILDVNVEGTRRLLVAARNAGVRRVVHTSSVGAIAARPGEVSTEEVDLDPFEEVADYERSKAAAELVVLREVARGLDCVIVNPSAIVGPYDFKPSLVGRAILDFAHGRMKAYVPGSFDWVAAKDVVSGHLLAMEKGRSGERYILSGEQRSLDEILHWLSELTGRAVPKLRIPAKTVLPLVIAKDWLTQRLFPQATPRFNQHSIRILTCGKRLDSSKAQAELGYAPSSIKEALQEAVQWFREHGML